MAYPGNISYKRQARSLATPGAEAYERFLQRPLRGLEDEWPYDSDWLTEIRAMGGLQATAPLGVHGARRRHPQACSAATGTR
jgi:hypothetical protein